MQCDQRAEALASSSRDRKSSLHALKDSHEGLVFRLAIVIGGELNNRLLLLKIA